MALAPCAEWTTENNNNNKLLRANESFGGFINKTCLWYNGLQQKEFFKSHTESEVQVGLWNWATFQIPVQLNFEFYYLQLSNES